MLLSMYDFETEVYKDKAEAQGFKVLLGDDTTLLLDLDDDVSISQWESMGPKFAEEFEPEQITIWHSKSGTGVHVKIILAAELDVFARIALQSILGSDPLRDLLSILRVQMDKTHPIMLFQPPNAIITEVKF